MERNALVDKLKGYACFLVLFGHVIMGIRLAEINIPSFFEGLEKFIWSFHVALFLFLSGVVYNETGEWKSKKTKVKFLLHKLLNLGVPYFVFSAAYILINSFVGQANTQSFVSDVFNLWKTPVAQYWFLYVLFFSFCIYTALSGLIKNWLITLIIVVIGYGVSFLGGSLGSFEIVFFSAWAFGIGTFIDFSWLTKLPNFLKYIVILSHVAVGVLLILFGKIEKPFVKEIMILFGIYSSIMFIFLLQSCKIVSRFLLFINKYSFQIYLLHTIFTAGIRIVLLRVNITQWWIHVILGTAGGLLLSVLAAIIAKKVKVLEFFFFPTKTIKTIKAKN